MKSLSRSDPPDAIAPSEAIVRVLLVAATVGVAGFLIAAWGWYRTASASIDLDALSPEVRQQLAEELAASSPGIYRWTWFEPRIGYTLNPDTELTEGGESFRSNELGYRTGPAAKAEGVFRVVFVGDSWTYGMGVRADQSFPQVFARLANEHSGLEREIEAWTLALPGYNLFNGLTALEFFFERLQPDAVVVTISGNDHHSTLAVLPNGSLGRAMGRRDEFGDPHGIRYSGRNLDSFRSRARWRASFERLRASEEWLRQREIPLLLFFLAIWREADVHAHVTTGNLSAPYLFAPAEFTRREWQNPMPPGHGNPATNDLYARMVYRGAVHLLGWSPLREGHEGPVVEVFDAPPKSQDWQALYDESAAIITAAQIPDSFSPSRRARKQVAGLLDLDSGLIGRAATIRVSPPAGARRLRIVVRKLQEAPSLYPLGLTVRIPTPGGGTEVTTIVPADGPATHRFSLEIPADVPPGFALDVVFVAERTAALPNMLEGCSVYINSIRGAGSRPR